MNKLIGFAILGLGAYYLYEKWGQTAAIAAGETGTTTTPGVTTGNTSTLPTTTTTNQGQAPTPDPNNPNTGFAADAQKTIALMTANGVTQANLDTISYYYQAATGKSISPSQFDKILSMAGGDRTAIFDLNYFMQMLAHTGYYPGLGVITQLYSRGELLYRNNSTSVGRFGNARVFPNDARKYERIM